MIVLSNCMSAQSVALFTMQIYFSGMFLIVFEGCMRFLDYMEFVLPVFHLKCGYIIVATHFSTVFNQIQCMIQSNVRNSIPGIFMNPI